MEKVMRAKYAEYVSEKIILTPDDIADFEREYEINSDIQKNCGAIVLGVMEKVVKNIMEQDGLTKTQATVKAKKLTKLHKDVFSKLKNSILDKTETLILAQFYFMLGTCAFYSYQVVADQGLYYLENARKQTQLIPGSTKFYSCMTKELVTRDQFIKQIDSIIDLVKSRS